MAAIHVQRVVEQTHSMPEAATGGGREALGLAVLLNRLCLANTWGYSEEDYSEED
jgi:hypothetical protein